MPLKNGIFVGHRELFDGYASVVVIAVTSCFCARRTANDKPTYPTPATVIFIIFDSLHHKVNVCF